MLKEVPTRNRVAGVLPAELRDVSCEVMMIGPHNVDFFLSMNTRNYRSVKSGRVKRFAADMLAGRWTLVTDAIGVTVSEVLTNGQNRLNAIKATGCTVPMLVIWNLPDGAEKDANTDSQQPRGADTHLAASGVSNGPAVAATIRLLYAIFSDRTFKGELTNSAILAVADEMPEIAEAAFISTAAGKFSRPSVAAAWYLIAANDNKDLADECLQVFCREVKSSNFHPMSTVHDYIKNKDLKGRSAVGQYKMLNAMLHAYQIATTGREAKMIRVADELKLPSSASALKRKFMSIVCNQE